MTTHNLKTTPPYFRGLWIGQKTFEFRKDDRGFKVGDDLCLEEYLPESQKFTGRRVYRYITYILKDFLGIEDGYCVLGIKEH